MTMRMAFVFVTIALYITCVKCQEANSQRLKINDQKLILIDSKEQGIITEDNFISKQQQEIKNVSQVPKVVQNNNKMIQVINLEQQAQTVQQQAEDIDQNIKNDIDQNIKKDKSILKQLIIRINPKTKVQIYAENTIKQQEQQNKQININIDHNSYNKDEIISSKRRNKLISVDQLKLAISLMKHINGNVIYKQIISLNQYIQKKQYKVLTDEQRRLHQQDNNKISQKQQPAQILSSLQTQKQYINQLIQNQKHYYNAKYQYLKEEDKSLTSSFKTIKELPFCLVVPSYNNSHKQLYKRNINSILQQEYNNYKVVHIDDHSQDNTMDNVINYLNTFYDDFPQKNSLSNTFQSINQQQLNEYRITLQRIQWRFIRNPYRKGALQNIYNALHNYCNEDQIAIIIDGDDALVGTQVLKLLNHHYQQSKYIFVYSSYAKKIEKQEQIREQEETLQINQQLLKQTNISNNLKEEKQKKEEEELYNKLNQSTQTKFNFKLTKTYYSIGPGIQLRINSFRQHRFRKKSTLIASHLLTFYVSLFKKINKTYFIDQNQKFYQYAYDRAITLPLAQLAYQNTYYLKEILYQYRADTGINDQSDKWIQASIKIRNKQTIEKLTDEEIKQLLINTLKSHIQ